MKKDSKRDSSKSAIDIVVMWVNTADELSQREKAKYTALENNAPETDPNLIARYRDWDNLCYWFRGIEKFAPWVRTIHFVTWRTVPAWLNTEHPKLNIVLNRDILPAGCDPVFSANPLETNLHRIEGIAERFVYFNDDMFLINDTQPDDFYFGGLPREMAVSYVLTNSKDNDTFSHMLFTMTGIINGFFSKQSVQKQHFFQWFNPIYGKQLKTTILTAFQRQFSGILIPHLPSPMMKSTYEEVWSAIPEQLMETAGHKFRNPMDITQYIFRYWAICKGEFKPTNIFRQGKEFFMNDGMLGDLCKTIEQKRYKMICINDDKKIENFERCRDSINSAFQKILPEKSSYEINLDV